MSNLRPTLFTNINSVILTAQGPRQIHEFNFPIKHNHFIILEPILVGVCHSDIKEIRGLREARSQFGHELVAKVVTSSDDLDFEPGNLVALNPNIELNRNSGFSSLIVAEGTKENLKAAFYLLPINVEIPRLIFAEPLACATHCIMQTLKYLKVNSFQGKRVVIYGAGMAGILLAIAAKKFKAEVLLVNRNRDRLDFLLRVGLFAAHELCLTENNKQLCDIAIIATTFVTNDIIVATSRFVANKSLIIIYGGTNSGDNFSNIDLNLLRISEQNSLFSLNKKSITLLGSYGTDRISFQAAIDWLVATNSDLLLEKLIISTVALDELVEQLRLMVNERTLGKVVVKL